MSPAPHRGLSPHWSPTQAQKTKCPQRQMGLSLGPSVLVPAVTSLEKCQCPGDGAALPSLPLSLQAGAPLQGFGVAWGRQQNPVSATGFTGKVTFAGRTALPLGEPPLAPAHSRAGNSAWSREERKVFNSVTDLENVSVHPRHSWGLFLPVANAEENASVLPQARMGHSTCIHRHRATPTSQVFHSNTGQ